jgi:hypothetical protein
MDSMKKNPFAEKDESADFNVTSGALQVYEYIEQKLNDRGLQTFVDRGSAATLCARRRWYQRKGTQGTALTPRKIINFLQGDISERVQIHFIEEACVGPGKLYSEVYFGKVKATVNLNGKMIKFHEQLTFSYDIDGTRIYCHPDGLGKRNSDGKWELIENKSAGNFGYQEFVHLGPGDYLKQVHSVMLCDELSDRPVKVSAWEKTLQFLRIKAPNKQFGKVRDVRFFYMKKDTGHLFDRAYKFNPEIARQVIAEYRSVRLEVPPPDLFPLKEEMYLKKPTGYFIAQFPCSYCPFLKDCKGEFKKEWEKDRHGNQKPVFIFDPNGQETA